MALGLMGDNLRERGFPHARRPPENHGGHQIALNHAAQDFALADQVLLSGKLIEVLRAKALRQRRGGIRGGQEGFLRHFSSLSFWVAAVLCGLFGFFFLLFQHRLDILIELPQHLHRFGQHRVFAKRRVNQQQHIWRGG